MRVRYFICFLGVAILISLTQCSTTRKFVEPEIVLPNMIHINDYLYADMSEISNSGYLLYLQWIEHKYGIKSWEYQSAKPDTNKIECFGLSGKSYIEYILSSKTADYPVVGVTLTQAMSYTNWRTDRVIEMMLIKSGRIKNAPEQKGDSCFTLSQYIEGNLDQIKIHENFKAPIFRIPTKSDWVKINEIKTAQLYYNFNSIHDVDTLEAYQNIGPARGENLDPNSRISKDSTFYNLYGNVAEMVEANNLSKGGSWRHSLAQSHKDSTQIYNSPNCWTGFRNVASVFEIKVKKKKEEQAN